MKLSINYLVPLLINFEEKKYICMVDYKNGKVFFIDNDNDISDSDKEYLSTNIINAVDSKAIFDVQSDVSFLSGLLGKIDRNCELIKNQEETDV